MAFDITREKDRVHNTQYFVHVKYFNKSKWLVIEMKVVLKAKVNVLAEELMKYCSVNLHDKKK